MVLFPFKEPGGWLTSLEEDVLPNPLVILPWFLWSSAGRSWRWLLLRWLLDRLELLHKSGEGKDLFLLLSMQQLTVESETK